MPRTVHILLSMFVTAVLINDYTKTHERQVLITLILWALLSLKLLLGYNNEK